MAAGIARDEVMLRLPERVVRACFEGVYLRSVLREGHSGI